MTIRHLSETIINQIAAGEVIERPASVVKELVENAIDAGATQIEIVTAAGGKNLIRVIDNGTGIPADELSLAIARHCTSKMGDDVHDIRALGFRGEALPSIGSVARLKLVSRTASADEAHEILVQAGKIDGPRPAAANRGTMVEVRDLFFAIPARLKFLKSDRAENTAITDIIKRIALAFPHIRFTLSGNDRGLLDLSACSTQKTGQLERMGQVLGKDFTKNTLDLHAVREAVKLTGFVGLPSFNRSNSLQQFAYVNGRPVRDKLIFAAIKAAYADAIPHDRHAVVAIFLELPPHDVDVNVHPAKADVRFRDPSYIRSLIIGGIREALQSAGIRSAPASSQAMFNAFKAPTGFSQNSQTAYRFPLPTSNSTLFHQPLLPPHALNEPKDNTSSPSPVPSESASEAMVTNYPLGVARAQIYKNYIIAQTDDSLIIVDQHAAHERLIYEALKQALYKEPLPSQLLLMPEIVELPSDDANNLAQHADDLQKFGLILEPFGPEAIVVREVPALLNKADIQALIRDLADEIQEHGTAQGIKAMLDHIAATMACHGSVRAGRVLRGEEMNALLRQMEATPNANTCNHGRPTYIELKLHDIERLFGRR
ncbi:DNA mismatch repair endonuclease MutL [Bartonella sp. DGB2]|uniref:DNA mismatch repair endonuclease MutL n=1 Tax=Bartonella sp. DGB2 TaxID=3388426 RepID=UPI00399036E9